ncbi:MULTISPECIES: VOC family protein [Pseudonocardia]|uniref:Glyoxalase-like domain protein n=2 Tax=Pseudonocardia TaxID=1847 RepID=A0A1Y2MJM9_PSEAH|nr:MULTISPECIES: VOC family protein [Pseudonocardia]OSY35450.1 Glyoxalase-like domain protein [Pseudonocardia autotrophica]TDN72201.1 putative lactoylglutathione lyase [Pseudonocardia autotrophica]BBG02908.1 glyoxalase [Pseudonocardia autotrophica]GEC27628.1 glyoxalase [Pseudonocardia saturnea]
MNELQVVLTGTVLPVEERPIPVVDHVTIVVSDLAVSDRFYTAALAPLGIERLRSGDVDGGVAFGRPHADDFGIMPAGEVAATTTAHIAFGSPSRAAVDDFYRAALATGGESRRPPGVQTEYSEGYYAAFVSDPDGNNIEAVHHG